MEYVLNLHNAPLSAASEKTIRRKLDSATGRLRARIRRIHICLADDNGPKGGLDKKCRIVADVAGVGFVVVEERQDSFVGAATHALHRLGRAIHARLGRRIENMRRASRIGHYVEVVH